MAMQHYRPHAVNPGRECDALRVVACRRAHHAAAFVGLGHECKLVEWPPDLVRADALEQLRLETDVVARQIAELPRPEEGRVLDVGRDAVARGLKVCEGEGEHGCDLREGMRQSGKSRQGLPRMQLPPSRACVRRGIANRGPE